MSKKYKEDSGDEIQEVDEEEGEGGDDITDIKSTPTSRAAKPELKVCVCVCVY